MGYSKRRACSKPKVSPQNLLQIQQQYLRDIKAAVQLEDIPADLVLNWDQTAMKIVPAGTWTMDKKGAKCIKIAAVDDKCMITAVFTNSLSGNFLPIQLVYQGTTQKCLPKNVSFPKKWHITCSANRWLNETTMIAYLNHTIISYVNTKCKEPSLDQRCPVLAIFDVFKGQCTENVFRLLEENNIILLYVIMYSQ